MESNSHLGDIGHFVFKILLELFTITTRVTFITNKVKSDLCQ